MFYTIIVNICSLRSPFPVSCKLSLRLKYSWRKLCRSNEAGRKGSAQSNGEEVRKLSSLTEHHAQNLEKTAENGVECGLV